MSVLFSPSPWFRFPLPLPRRLSRGGGVNGGGGREWGKGASPPSSPPPIFAAQRKPWKPPHGSRPTRNAPGGGARVPRRPNAAPSRLRSGGAEGGGGLVCERMCEGRRRPGRAWYYDGRGPEGAGGCAAAAAARALGLVFGGARAADPSLAAAAARVSRAA